MNNQTNIFEDVLETKSGTEERQIEIDKLYSLLEEKCKQRSIVNDKYILNGKSIIMELIVNCRKLIPSKENEEYVKLLESTLDLGEEIVRLAFREGKYGERLKNMRDQEECDRVFGEVVNDIIDEYSPKLKEYFGSYGEDFVPNPALYWRYGYYIAPLVIALIKLDKSTLGVKFIRYLISCCVWNYLSTKSNCKWIEESGSYDSVSEKFLRDKTEVMNTIEYGVHLADDRFCSEHAYLVNCLMARNDRGFSLSLCGMHLTEFHIPLFISVISFDKIADDYYLGESTEDKKRKEKIVFDMSVNKLIDVAREGLVIKYDRLNEICREDVLLSRGLIKLKTVGVANGR